MAFTVTQINTALTGTAGTNNQNTGPAGTDGGAAPLASEAFSGQNFALLGSNLDLFPRVTGGLGGSAAAGAYGKNAVASVTHTSTVDGLTSTYTTHYTTGATAGGAAGSGGDGGDASLTMANDTIGAPGSVYASSFTLSADTTGGVANTGQTGGQGGAGGASEDESSSGDGFTTTSLSSGAAGGAGGNGGNGGNGGTADSDVSGLSSDVSLGTTVSLFANGAAGGSTSGISGGFGGLGGDAQGGAGGNGGNGGDATATLTGSTMVDADFISVSVGARGGGGGVGGAGAAGGPSERIAGGTVYDYGSSPSGNGGNGGNGGSADATLSGNTLSAPQITVTLDAEGGAGGAGGTGGVEHDSNNGTTQYINATTGAAGATGADGSGLITFTNNEITVGTSSTLGFPNQLNFDLAVYQAGSSSTIALNGGSGGNLVFSGNTFIGNGTSSLFLDVADGGVTVNTASNSISINGSPTSNSLTGFDFFYLDKNDTFVWGAGTYTVEVNADPDTIVFTPSSGKGEIENATATDLMLNFQGFGSSLDSLTQLAADTTTSGGNTFINFGSGPIELLGTVSLTASNVEFTPACYLRGTRVLTETGEVPVEDLAIGDKVMTLSGPSRPIKWIGRRSYDPRFVAGNRAVLPIRIAAGALGDGVPARDLWVSPEHALHLDGALVPARLLVNGATITQITAVERIEYFHIELAAHDVIFAEGAPAETFVDCDNRLMFQNGAEFAALYPGDTAMPWDFCAPRVEAGSAELVAIRAALLQRAETLGHRLDSDPDLHLVVDGEIIRADTSEGGIYRFQVPGGSTAVQLVSRSVVPAEIEAGSRDIRRLGVAVERIALGDGAVSIEARHDDAGLSEGFHQDEGSHRWTDGLARLPEGWLHSFPGGAVLEIRLVPNGLGYRLPPPDGIAAAAA